MTNRRGKPGRLLALGIDAGLGTYAALCALYLATDSLPAAGRWALAGALAGTGAWAAGRSLGAIAAGIAEPVPPSGADLAVPGRSAARRPAVWAVQAGLIAAVTYAAGWKLVEIDPVALVTHAGNARHIVDGLIHPNWDILADMLRAIVETVFLALMATTFAAPVAAVFGFLGARNLMPRTPAGNFTYYGTRTLFNVVRSVEAISWAIIFVVWVGIGPFAGMLALWAHSVAAMGKLFSEQVETIDPGPVEALQAAGAGSLQTVVFAVVPQVVIPFIGYTLYRWDMNVRMATIVGFVGGGGIGGPLYQYQELLQWRNVGLILWLVTAVVWVMDISSGRIRERLA